MKKTILLMTILGTTLFANIATKAVKHEMKELKYDVKKDLDVNKKIKKEKRKMEIKAVKAIL